MKKHYEPAVMQVMALFPDNAIAGVLTEDNRPSNPDDAIFDFDVMGGTQ